MFPVDVSVQLAAASATAVTTAQTLAAAGNFTIDGVDASGGVATLDTYRRVLVTCAADETGHNFFITGTTYGGYVLTEEVAGVNTTTAYTINDFLTVTQVRSDSATTGNVSFGTNAIGSSRWVYPSAMMTPFNLSIACSVSGTVTYGLEYAYDDPAGHPYDFPVTRPTVTVFPDGTVTAKTSNAVAALTAPVTAWRLTVTAGTGQATATGVQAGIAGP